MRLSLFLLFFTSFSLSAQDFSPTPKIKTPDSSIPNLEFEIIEMCGCGMEAHYAGGSSALSSFINDNISLSNDINWGNTERVLAYVVFVVEKDGSLSDIHIVKTNFPEVNESILSVFKKMDNWIAGEAKCVSVRTRVRVPILLAVR